MCPKPLAKRSALGLAALAWLALAGVAIAQVSTATIQGTVRDDTGVLPGANVTARHVQSGFTHEAVSTADGSYTLGGLRPGEYEITVAFSQFKPQARNGLGARRAGDHRRLPGHR